jgi:hypothetical protein
LNGEAADFVEEEQGNEEVSILGERGERKSIDKLARSWCMR